MLWFKKIYLYVDKFLLLLISVVILASLFPCEGEMKRFFNYLTTGAIALLFFMHGAKLSRQAIFSGLAHWRLHLVVFCSTFVLFPLLGLSLHIFVPMVISPTIYAGLLFLCVLPGTIQSAIAYTSLAGGNVPAAICSSSASSLLGIFISPILIGLFLQHQGKHSSMSHAIGAIILQIMLPFILGNFSRIWIAKWVERYKKIINMTDRSTILLVVYTAFSAAVSEGIWQKITSFNLLIIVSFALILLTVVLVINTVLARWLGFNTADEITIVFCGSKKGLANGISMANVLFPVSSIGMMVLPLMIFHQLQLMVCAVLAGRYANRQGNKSIKSSE